jgi:hypothetical protein
MTISDECRVMADNCMRLARIVSMTHQRAELLDIALLLLKSATSCDDAPLVLPSAPTLLPTIPVEISTEQVPAADDNVAPSDEAAELITKALEALPEASTITYCTAQLGDLLWTAWPLGSDRPASTGIECIAKACQCSWLFAQRAGTVTFIKDSSLASSRRCA